MLFSEYKQVKGSIRKIKKGCFKTEVCRNKRCTFFFSSITKEKFDIFKQQYFEDFFDLCVPCI